MTLLCYGALVIVGVIIINIIINITKIFSAKKLTRCV